MPIRVRKGKDRIVLVLPHLRVVIKFPIIHIITAVRSSLRALRKGRLGYRWCHRYLRRLLYEGLESNWREFRFYRRTHHPFLQPSYFSLFGLFNVQRMGRPCAIKPVDLWCQLYELTQGAVFKSSHHFDNPGNFCFQNGSLRMLDYGSPHVQEVVSEFGLEIVESFDPKYDWEERKRQLKREREASI